MSSQGPNYPTTEVDDNDNGNAWSSLSNLGAADGNYATVSNGSLSNTIKVTGYGFSIPSGATINGIVVQINRKSAQSGTKASQDQVVQMLKANSAVGSNYAATGTNWPTTAATA